MKNIALTDEEYATLLEFKNFMTMKLHGVSNIEAIKLLTGKSGTDEGIDNIRRLINYEPEYTFGDCITDTIKSVMNEQETGNVNFIT